MALAGTIHVLQSEFSVLYATRKYFIPSSTAFFARSISLSWELSDFVRYFLKPLSLSNEFSKCSLKKAPKFIIPVPLLGVSVDCFLEVIEASLLASWTEEWEVVRATWCGLSGILGWDMMAQTATLSCQCNAEWNNASVLKGLNSSNAKLLHCRGRALTF